MCVIHIILSILLICRLLKWTRCWQQGYRNIKKIYILLIGSLSSSLNRNHQTEPTWAAYCVAQSKSSKPAVENWQTALYAWRSSNQYSPRVTLRCLKHPMVSASDSMAWRQSCRTSTPTRPSLEKVSRPTARSSTAPDRPPDRPTTWPSAGCVRDRTWRSGFRASASVLGGVTSNQYETGSWPSARRSSEEKSGLCIVVFLLEYFPTDHPTDRPTELCPRRTECEHERVLRSLWYPVLRLGGIGQAWLVSRAVTPNRKP